MWVVNNRKIFYAISLVLVGASIISLLVWGLKPGIDFTGGTLIDVSYPNGRPEQNIVEERLVEIDPAVSVRPSSRGEVEGYIVRMKAVAEAEESLVREIVSPSGSGSIVNTFDSIGPILGKEAVNKALWSILLVIIAIVLYITFAFRKVSEPVSSSKYGLIAIVALAHDVIIPAGVFAFLGQFAGYEVDTLFVTALLVILGFSVHDTIVVFDRVRENLRHSSANKPFDMIVGNSISQTFIRSINTSLTTLIALIVLYIVGGSTTAHFSLVLIIGIAAGTYSSIFVGSPLLVTVQKWGKK